MIEDINTALEPLKTALAANGKVPVIPQEALVQRFHGLNLRQLVQLTAAPALAVLTAVPEVDGDPRECYTIDGNDRDKCSLVARELLLEPAAHPTSRRNREVHLTCGDNDQFYFRDGNDAVYSLLDGKTVVDPELTTLVRQQVLHPSEPQGTAISRDGDQLLVARLKEVLEEVATLRICNGAARDVVEKLITTSGQPDPLTAVAAAPPESIVSSVEQMLTASMQIDRLAVDIANRLGALLALVRSVGPLAPSSSATAEKPLLIPDQADTAPLAHEPF